MARRAGDATLRSTVVRGRRRKQERGLSDFGREGKSRIRASDLLRSRGRKQGRARLRRGGPPTCPEAEAEGDQRQRSQECERERRTARLAQPEPLGPSPGGLEHLPQF